MTWAESVLQGQGTAGRKEFSNVNLPTKRGWGFSLRLTGGLLSMATIFLVLLGLAGVRKLHGDALNEMTHASEVQLAWMGDQLRGLGMPVERVRAELLRMQDRSGAEWIVALHANGDVISTQLQAGGALQAEVVAAASASDTAGGLLQGHHLVRWNPVGSEGWRLVAMFDAGPTIQRANAFAAAAAAALAGLSLLGVAMALVLRAHVRLTNRLAASLWRPFDLPQRALAEPSRWIAGEFANLQAAVTNCMEVLRRERRQREEHKALHADIGKLAQEALLLLDSQGRIVMLNGAAETLFGLPSAQALRRPFAGLLSPAGQAAFEALMCDCLSAVPAKAWASTQDLELFTFDGRVICTRLTFGPVHQGESTYIAVHVRDRTDELRRTDELEQALRAASHANAAKSRFLANVSHEIRTPLSGMCGMLELFASTRVKTDEREALEAALASARQLQDLLNSLLDLSEIEVGSLRCQSVPFDVDRVLLKTIRAFEIKAREKGLQLKTSFRTPQRMLMGDPLRICQILNNVLDNAVKFTAKGHVSVRVSTTPVNDSHGRSSLVLSVSDTGIGISEDRREAVLEPFVQADEHTTRQYGGTGLGLPLSKQLAELMGGGLRVEASGSGGCAVTVILPCKAAEVSTDFQETVASLDTIMAELEGRRVLLVDDNAINRRLLQRWLEMANMWVDVCGDGETAIQMVSREPYDLLLLDVSLPGLDGIQVTRAIRRMGGASRFNLGRCATLPIIGITARNLVSDRATCLEAGMDEFLNKPVARDHLIQNMTYLLSGRRAQTTPVPMDVSMDEFRDTLPLAPLMFS